MIRVAINNTALSSGHKTRGIGFYTKNLIDSLRAHLDITVLQFSMTKDIKRADIVHYPNFDFFQMTLPFKRKFPTVVTIHDVIPLLFPEHYPPGIKGRLKLSLQKRSLKSISGVITDSEVSKKDIHQILGVELRKIYVTYLAPATHFKAISDKKRLKEIKDKYNLVDQFAIFVGSVNWNKNLLNLTQASVDAGIDIYLIGKNFEEISVSNHPELRSYKQFLEKYSNHPKVHLLGFIPDEEIVEIYNLASILLLPSFYEGFGLPILEAQTCGLPVITSNTSCMPEIAGEGAILVNPESIEEIKQGIEKIINDKKFTESLINGGFKNVKKFSWNKTADETVKVYQHVLKNH